MREAGVPSDTRIVLSLFILRIAPICTRYPPATLTQTAVALYAVKVNISGICCQNIRSSVGPDFPLFYP